MNIWVKFREIQTKFAAHTYRFIDSAAKQRYSKTTQNRESHLHSPHFHGDSLAIPNFDSRSRSRPQLDEYLSKDGFISIIKRLFRPQHKSPNSSLLILKTTLITQNAVSLKYCFCDGTNGWKR